MEWFLNTKVFREMHGMEGGETGIDNSFAEKAMANKGAWILGRNMFGPIRGPWPDEEWKGWWGDEPPYHVPTFVLTHYEREPVEMKGGTTFHFVTDGVHSALEQAKAAAGDRDIRVGGGPATIRQYLRERLIDQMHLVMRPLLLGQGEPLFADLDLRVLGYACTGSVPGERGVHVIIDKQN
jgi:dihydrofolate reductase